ncbi:NAD(P)/FAD-dependent oxidoreductase [Streptomyces sp. NPDC055092]
MTQVRGAGARRVVVVGAGHAGTTVVSLLRQGRFSGEVTLLGDESELPYHRPPLSKKLSGDALEQWLRPAQFYRAQSIDLQLNERVVEIDRAARAVRTSSGRAFGYDFLVLATGAVPRSLPVPGSHLEGVFALRTLADARLLRSSLPAGSTVAIIGGGYIGLEVAAAARTQGLEATVIERESRVLARVASPQLAQILTRHHELRGTSVVTEAHVTHLEGDGGRVRAVHLPGRRIACDAVLVGIGALPQDALAAAAGLHCDDGIVVDSRTRTSDPQILAAGDATRRPVTGLTTLRRLESIPSATEQARQTCAVILGTTPPPEEIPWFWSDQFDLKVKIAGVLSGTPGLIERGDPASDRFALFHHQGQVVTAVECVNSAAEFTFGKKLIASRRKVDPACLADPHVPLSNAVLK